jgi:DNA-binding NtrC family response regulator
MDPAAIAEKVNLARKHMKEAAKLLAECSLPIDEGVRQFKGDIVEASLKAERFVITRAAKRVGMHRNSLERNISPTLRFPNGRRHRHGEGSNEARSMA